MKILHTADWHIGPRKGPVIDGVNMRGEDTYRCIEKMIMSAREQQPDFVLISGDIFDVATVGQARSHTEVLKIREYVRELRHCARHVIVMRGTPNHDSSEAFTELKAHFDNDRNVHIITEPQLLTFGEGINIAIVPGFDRGIYRASHPGLSKEEENQAFTEEIAKIVIGLKEQCNPNFPSVLMAHITVPGCNMEAGQNTFLQNFEPVLTTKTLNTAGYDLVCLGHIHRPQELPNCQHVFYSGGINAFNFNDEGQQRGYYIHEFTEDGLKSTFYTTPYREFQSIYLDDKDIAALNGQGDASAVEAKWRGSIDGKIVRVLYSCTEEHEKGFDMADLERWLYNDGAYWVQEITPQNITVTADRTNMGDLDPEANLRQYLTVRGTSPEDIERLVTKARPIITNALNGSSKAAYTGTFVPVEISVKNYRNYVDETFSFDPVSFCTINGVNGAGKSSLFMDAILDALWEEPREGDLTGWIRNDESARSGSIIFTFRIGEKTFRVSRTRTKSGKATLNLAELVDGQWVNRSREKMKDTQQEINDVLGMDSMTFKSCALIMQDQYGLFLQAPKDQRMAVLGKLLGLGVYDIMEDQARETGKTFGAKMRDRKAQIDVTEQQIESFGNPDEEIEQFEASEKSIKIAISGAQKNLDNVSDQLAKKTSAQEESMKILDEIHKLQSQKNELQDQLSIKTVDLDKCEQSLKGEAAIHEAAETYRQLKDQRPDLVADVARYESLTSQIPGIQKRISDIESAISLKQDELNGFQFQLESLKSQEDVDALKAKDQEYEEASNRLTELQELRSKAIEAKSSVNQAKLALSQVDYSYEQDVAALNSRIRDLEHRSHLLQDSQCIDIEHANCVFLRDAKEAGKQIDEVKAQIDEITKRHESSAAEAKQKVDELEAKLSGIGFSQDEYEETKKKVSGLAYAHLQYQQAASGEARRGTLQARIEADEGIIAEKKKELSGAQEELSGLSEKNDAFMAAKSRLSQLDTKIFNLEPQADLEKELPVWKERAKADKERIDDINQRLPEIDSQITEKNAKAQELYRQTTDIEMLKANKAQAESQLEHLRNQLASVQREIGALEQKMDQIEKLEDSIKADREAVASLAAETADYDTLKDAFGQDGIPHQIVRSVIPKLTSTANAILGQMTGGKMGIEFRTEKTLKSNKNKEVETLDILITEYGKTTLPYLSKSGGEKVKASLSVILALAETKSSTAGTQFGMLFIDEPPFLDADGVQAYCDALVTIQSRYPQMKIMAVTHDPTMKARFPQSVTVTKDEEGSHVTWD